MCNKYWFMPHAYLDVAQLTRSSSLSIFYCFVSHSISFSLSGNLSFLLSQELPRHIYSFSPTILHFAFRWWKSQHTRRQIILPSGPEWTVFGHFWPSIHPWWSLEMKISFWTECDWTGRIIIFHRSNTHRREGWRKEGKVATWTELQTPPSILFKTF